MVCLFVPTKSVGRECAQQVVYATMIKIKALSISGLQSVDQLLGNKARDINSICLSRQYQISAMAILEKLPCIIHLE